MLIEVACYAGYRYPERPLSFTLKGRQFKVARVLDRWVGEAEIYFKVLAEDRRIYLLKYATPRDIWTLEGLFQPSGPLPPREED